MRDVATSYLHSHAKAEGLDMDCIKLWCGQVAEIDPLRYDKFHANKKYVREEYLIAEKFLNIVSNPQAATQKNKKFKECRSKSTI